MNLRFSLRPGISPIEIENVKNSVGYLGDDILRYSVEQQSLEIILRDGANSEEIQGNIHDLLKSISDEEAAPDAEVIFDRSDVEVSYPVDAFEFLKNSGQVFEHAPGVFTYRGTFLKLLQQLDRKIKNFASTFNAEEVMLPNTAPLRILNQGKFFQLTPQYANFMAPLVEVKENVIDFKNSVEQYPNKKIHSFLKEPDAMCRHAVCVHAYDLIAKKRFARGESLCLTSSGKVFRNEMQYFELERLREFTTTEIMFFGPTEYVADSLKKCQDWLQGIIVDLKLRGVIRTAADSFFADNRQALQFMQLKRRSKIEGILYNSRQTEVAFASVNEHSTHFTDAFDIQCEDGSAFQSGCFGVGFERLIFMIMSQHGPEVDSWPSNVCSFFFDN